MLSLWISKSRAREFSIPWEEFYVFHEIDHYACMVDLYVWEMEEKLIRSVGDDGA